MLSFASAAPITTDDKLFMAYYLDPAIGAGTLDLDIAQQEYYSGHGYTRTDQYVEGILEVNQATSVAYHTDVYVRTRTDGWIVAWIPQTTPKGIADIYKWDTTTNSNITTTTLENAISRIMTKMGHASYYSSVQVKYYSGTYPLATNLFIVGSRDYSNSSTTWYMTKHGITAYSADACYAGYRTNYTSYFRFNKVSDPTYTIATNPTTLGCYNIMPTLVEDEKYKGYTYSQNSYARIKGAFISFYSVA